MVNKIEQKEIVKTSSDLILNKEKVDIVRDIVANSEVRLKELEMINDILPKLLQLQPDLIIGLKAFADNSGNSQASAFSILNQQMEVLKLLAENSQSDEIRENILKNLFNTNEIIERMNTENNNSWQYLALLAGGVSILSAAFLFYKIYK